LLRALRQSMELSCAALMRFDLRRLEEHMERQRQLAPRIATALAGCSVTRADLAALLPELREAAALNRVQAALVASGCRAVQLELNLARLAHPESALAYGEG
jgi:hypothetical protein